VSPGAPSAALTGKSAVPPSARFLMKERRPNLLSHVFAPCSGPVGTIRTTGLVSGRRFGSNPVLVFIRLFSFRCGLLMVSRSPPRVQNSSVLTGWQEVIFTIMIARVHTALLEGLSMGRIFRAAGIKRDPSRIRLFFLFLPDTLRFPTLCALPLRGAPAFADQNRSKYSMAGEISSRYFDCLAMTLSTRDGTE